MVALFERESQASSAEADPCSGACKASATPRASREMGCRRTDIVQTLEITTLIESTQCRKHLEQPLAVHISR